MVRGVHKQVVEVNCTNDEYVERAILILRPEKCGLPSLLLKARAIRYLDTIHSPKKRRYSRNNLLTTLLLMVFGTTICLLLLLTIH